MRKSNDVAQDQSGLDIEFRLTNVHRFFHFKNNILRRHITKRSLMWLDSRRCKQEWTFDVLERRCPTVTKSKGNLHGSLI